MRGFSTGSKPAMTHYSMRGVRCWHSPDEAVHRDAVLHQEGLREGWEARARAITAENAALREEEPWPSR